MWLQLPMRGGPLQKLEFRTSASDLRAHLSSGDLRNGGGDAPADEKAALGREVYNYTGETGTYRYMAPEVFRHEPYNAKVWGREHGHCGTNIQGLRLQTSSHNNLCAVLLWNDIAVLWRLVHPGHFAFCIF